MRVLSMNKNILAQLINWDADDGSSFGMITDHTRNRFYDKILSDVTGKHCIDIGFGTGFLSFLALKYNPTHITAFEENSIRYELGNKLIKSLKLEDKITLINSAFNSTMVKDDYELAFHEILGQNLWNEGVYSTFHKQLKFLPSDYCCDFYLYELSDKQFNEYFQHTSDMWISQYNSIRGADWPDCHRMSDFNKLPNTIQYEIKTQFPTILYNLDTGVEFNVDYNNAVQPYLDIFLQKLSDFNLRSVANNFSKEEYNLMIDNSIGIMSYNTSTIEQTTTIDYHYNNTQEIIPISNNYIDLRLDKSLLMNKKLLVLYKYSLKHKEHTLMLTDCHCWTIPTNSIIINNMSDDVFIRQYFDLESGIRAWAE